MEREDIPFSPMAMPMLAGPGSISYLINLYSQENELSHHIMASIAILVISIIVFFILYYSKYLFKLLGESGLRAMARIMGFLVMAIGTQYLISGVVKLINNIN